MLRIMLSLLVAIGACACLHSPLSPWVPNTVSVTQTDAGLTVCTNIPAASLAAAMGDGGR